MLKERRRGNRQRRQHPSQNGHGEGGIEHRGPGEEADGSGFHTKRSQPQPRSNTQREPACSRICELHENACGRLHGGSGRHRFPSFFSTVFFPAVFISAIFISPLWLSAILRARRSSCLRSSTALSTMPRTSCSADPPQKRSMMLFTARTATFWRASEAL